MTRKNPFAFLIFAFCLLTFAPPLLPALDLGLVLDQGAEFSGSAGDTGFQYKGILIPRVSGLVGDNGRIYVSAGLNFQNDPWRAAPELLRTDIYWQPKDMEARAGRMLYSDPLGYVASGLFDGGRLSLDTAAGTFSAGAWYTGLVYKRRAAIEMTAKEAELYESALDYVDFAGTYFAPRRILSALDWEHQGLWEFIPARLSLLGQFGLGEEKLHSQYLAGKMSVPMGRTIFDLGGCLELIEASGGTYAAFAAELGVSIKGSAQGLTFLGRFSSGKSGRVAAFLPLTTVSQGHVLAPKLSGISLLALEYSARPHRAFSLGLSSFYFIRSDFETCPGFGNDGRLLGGEFYGVLYWSPASDIALNAGGGIFLPSLGNAVPSADSLWRASAGLTISLY